MILKPLIIKMRENNISECTLKVFFFISNTSRNILLTIEQPFLAHLNNFQNKTVLKAVGCWFLKYIFIIVLIKLINKCVISINLCYKRICIQMNLSQHRYILKNFKKMYTED